MFENEPFEPEKRRLRDSTGAKMVALGGLIILLLIPLGMVSSLTGEREKRRNEAAEAVAATVGKSQVLAGPVLTVPFRRHSQDAAGRTETVTSYARFLPEALRIEGRINPQRLHRGIFEVAIYQADLRWTGTFHRPSFSQWQVAPQDILWEGAYLAVSLPEGVRSSTGIGWKEHTLRLEPRGAEEGLWKSGLRAPVPDLRLGEEGDSLPFAYDLKVNGSQKLQFLPLGRQTTVDLRAAWPSPSFIGSALPEKREVTGPEFSALWNVPFFRRSYPQQWRHEEAEGVAAQEALEGSAFGVNLFVPVDAYQKTQRSVKYGVLFLLLTFLTFFLYEVFSALALHPMQYLLVGSALCVFYLLLLSFSEHLSFGLSYLVAAAATVLLIGGYSAAVLRGRLRALLMTAVLAALYGYLYILLQLEEYALLLGSVGLFAILALVMYLTRGIDWSGPRRLSRPGHPAH